MSEPRSIVDRLHEAFNARRFDTYAELLAEDVLMVVDGRQPIRGRAAVRDYAATIAREIPGAQTKVERVVAESDEEIVTRTRFVDASPPASEPATWGAWRLPLTIYEVYRVTRERIAERRTYIDDEPSADESSGDPFARAGVVRLMNEQAALRRVATLVARGAAQSEVFDAIVSETAELFGEEAWLLRFGVDATVTVLAQHGASSPDDVTGLTVSEDGLLTSVIRSGRPVRVDSYVGLAGPGPELARRKGVAATAGTPLIVQGMPWGALALVSRGPPLAGGIEHRLAQFADLAATAIANAQSRAELESLADEQAALRRVAELVARGAPTQEVFDQVTFEASRLLDDNPTTLLRYEPPAEAVVVAAQRIPEPAVGGRVPLHGDNGPAQLWRTGRTVRIDDGYQAVASASEPRWITAGVLTPIVVEGRLWGLLGAPSTSPLPAGTEQRLARFGGLVAVAIANAESRAALTASRRRIVASADEARRRLARDVHDGAQQRLVHALIRLKQARAELEGPHSAAAKLVDESLVQVQAANAQLRELAHGIAPAALTHGGLRAGVEALRADIPLPVQAEVLAGRLPEPVETTAYFVIAEALTNVIKHAGASRAGVRAIAVEDRLEVEVSDDGRGGAAPSGGSGLTGLIDRVEAVGGSIVVSSPPGAGTTLSAALPIEQPQASERS